DELGARAVLHQQVEALAESAVVVVAQVVALDARARGVAEMQHRARPDEDVPFAGLESADLPVRPAVDAEHPAADAVALRALLAARAAHEYQRDGYVRVVRDVGQKV